MDSASAPSPTLVCCWSVSSSSSEVRQEQVVTSLTGRNPERCIGFLLQCCFPSGLMWISSSSSLVSRALGCSRGRQMFRSRAAHCWSETNTKHNRSMFQPSPALLMKTQHNTFRSIFFLLKTNSVIQNFQPFTP